MSEAKSFLIDTELSPIYFNDVPKFIYQNHLLPHPPTYFRIERLEKMKTPVEAKHPLVQSAKDVFNGFRSAF